ncbi:MAG: serine/threonine-protein kinase [Ignavibacteria bacterium]
MTGKVISNYEIRSVIGSGGMGKVYLAKQLTIDREVAIKILDPSLSENPQFKERFINEANALAKLNHPNIVSIYDFVEYENNYCIIMEFVKGATLDNIIDNNVKLDLPFTINIIEQVLDGLSYAHKQSIVHRDIKPSNIIVDHDNRVRILDFGIAKLVLSNSNLTKTGTRMGSVKYMSPEQVLGKELNLKTDIYSTGITFYEILTGKPPFDSDTESDFVVQNKIVNDVLPDIRTVNPSVPQNIAEAIYTATQKNPDDRFRDCEEFKAMIINDYVGFDNKVKSNFTQQTLLIGDFNESARDKTVLIHKENDFQNSNENKSKKGLKIGITSLIIIVVIFTAFYFISKENDQITTTHKIQNEISNEPKSNSYDEKNKVLKKYRNTEIISREESKKAHELIDKWINSINKKDLNLGIYYSDKVNYYTAGKVNVAEVIKDKKNFYKKWDVINIKTEQYGAKKLSDDEFNFTFDKIFKVENYSGSKKMDGKVKSRLVFKEINGELKIISETDDFTYYLNKN